MKNFRRRSENECKENMLYSSSIMNLLCDVSMFQVNHIFFLDTKKNMVIDGKFTKIVYSDSVVSLNGLYLYCPIESDRMSQSAHVPTRNVSLFTAKSGASEVYRGLCTTNLGNQRSLIENYETTIVTKKIPFIFSLLNPTNIYLIKELNRIEHEIIEHYKEFFQIHKTNVYSLRNQLKSGNIKVVHKIPTEGALRAYVLCPEQVKLGKGQNASSLLTSKVAESERKPEKFEERASVPCSPCSPNSGGGHKERRPPEEFDTYDNIRRPIVVKISGIWETDVSIGITFKFQI